MIPVLGLVTLIFSGTRATSSTISHTGSVSPGSVVMVNGSFTYTSGTTPSVVVDFGTYPGGTFTPFSPPVSRNGNLSIVTPPTGTFSISPGYQGSAGVQVAFRSTLFEKDFFNITRNVANTVGTITP
jgi:hypothetical protein